MEFFCCFVRRPARYGYVQSGSQGYRKFQPCVVKLDRDIATCNTESNAGSSSDESALDGMQVMQAAFPRSQRPNKIGQNEKPPLPARRNDMSASSKARRKDATPTGRRNDQSASPKDMSATPTAGRNDKSASPTKRSKEKPTSPLFFGRQASVQSMTVMEEVKSIESEVAACAERLCKTLLMYPSGRRPLFFSALSSAKERYFGVRARLNMEKTKVSTAFGRVDSLSARTAFGRVDSLSGRHRNLEKTITWSQELTSLEDTHLCYWPDERASTTEDPSGAFSVASMDHAVHGVDDDQTKVIIFMTTKDPSAVTLKFATALDAETWTSDLNAFIELTATCATKFVDITEESE